MTKRSDRLILLATCLFAVVWLIPVIWVLVMSLKPNEVLLRSTSGFLPIPFTLENYVNVLSVRTVPTWLMHSLIVSFSMTVGVLVVSSMAGYAFARLDFPYKKPLFVFVIAGLMVPEQAVFIPIHTIVADLDMHNTHTALILPRLAVPIGVFLMTQFFRSVPRELEEAARLDHATHFTIFTRIMLPLSIPALTTLGLFTFIHGWNDYLWPLVSATRAEMYTVTVGLASIQGNFGQSDGLGTLMASAVFASAPIMLLFVIFQRFIVAGVAMGAGK